MSLLNELLNLKQYREERAELAVAGARVELENAVRHSEQAERELIEFRAWCTRRENEMYDEVMRRVVVPRELQWLREDVVVLRKGEHEKAGAVTKAHDRCTESENALQQAKQGHGRALRVREKFVHLVAQETAERELLVEYREENEREEGFQHRSEMDEEGRDEDE